MKLVVVHEVSPKVFAMKRTRKSKRSGAPRARHDAKLKAGVELMRRVKDAVNSSTWNGPVWVAHSGLEFKDFQLVNLAEMVNLYAKYNGISLCDFDHAIARYQSGDYDGIVERPFNNCDWPKEYKRTRYNRKKYCHELPETSGVCPQHN